MNPEFIEAWAKCCRKRFPDPKIMPNWVTIDFIGKAGCQSIAEIGVFKGGTSALIAKHLANRGELHLFDFEDRVSSVKTRLNACGFHNIIAHGNSHRIMDSYAWSLMKILRAREEPVFDYVFLDGSHTWGIDALAFFLIDRLLKVGGYIDFDDYSWSMAKSPTLRPSRCPATGLMHTKEQISESHVALIIDLLVRRDARYEPVIENKVFRKIFEYPHRDLH